MKKLLIAVVLGLLLVAGLVTMASADNGPHGGFTATTDACAGCHRMHSAQAGANALTRVPITELCLSCHEGGAGAGTDVWNGEYNLAGAQGATEGTDGSPLFGGGFAFAKMWTNTSSTGAAAPVTSSHDVDATGTVWASGAIDGVGNYGGSIKLECTSCHNPHGKAGYSDGTTSFIYDVNMMTTFTTAAPSYRLLRWRPSGSNGYEAAVANVNWNGGAFPSNGTETGWLVPDNYATSGTEWYTIGTSFAAGTNDYMPGNNITRLYDLSYVTAGPSTNNYSPAAANAAYFCAQCHDRILNNTRLRNDGDISFYCGVTDAAYSANLIAMGYPVTGMPVQPIASGSLHPGECELYDVTSGGVVVGQVWGDVRSSGDAVFQYRHNSGEIRTSTDGTVLASTTAAGVPTRTCLTCHVAHGTAAVLDVAGGMDAVFLTTPADPLAATTWGTNNMGASLNGDTTLLRMDGRTICMRCHAGAVGAAFP